MANSSFEIDTGHIRAATPDAMGVRCYKGIPYAAPPLRNLRWRPPQHAMPWNGVRACDSFGFNAPQRLLFDDINPFEIGVSEDCLTLNVWTPTTPEANGKLPVLFYIHGGGFAVGAGSEKRYWGARLASQNIVVVTVNYRLNALGHLAHPALTAESETASSGNFAKLDLVAALHWVQKNIAAFGGDPGAVTIAGESAGSMYVSMLMASPLARGLFHQAIGESGAQFASPERPMQSLAEAEEQGLAFAKKLGAKTVEDLRALSVDAILDANPGLGFWPIVDGHFLAEKPAAIFAKGKQADVPLLAGWNKDEGFNFTVMNWPPAKKGYEHLVKTMFGARAKEVLLHYPGGTLTIQSARELGADLLINHSTWAWLEAHRKTAKSDVFRYRFDRAPNTPKGWFPDGADAGAFHSCEILYVMNNLDAFPWLVDANDQQVADVASSFWVNFVKSGNPNGKGLPPWPSYRDDNRPSLNIDVTCNISQDAERVRQEFLASLLV